MVGRNEPCPCGSGKKYKKCCSVQHGELTLQKAKEQRFFDRKFTLTRDIMDFLIKEKGGQWAFDSFKEKPFYNEKEMFGNMWAIHFATYENGLRGIEWFVKEFGRRYSGEDREMLERWVGLRPSCFQVIDLYEHGVIIEDLWTSEQFRLPYCETVRDVPPWSVFIGLIEPFLDEWCPLGVLTFWKPDLKFLIPDWIAELGKGNDPSDTISSCYPELINRGMRANEDVRAIRNIHDVEQRTFITRQYSCDHPERLVDLLLSRPEQYVRIPNPEEDSETIEISRMEKMDQVFTLLSQESRDRLNLGNMHISKSLVGIRIERNDIIVTGWEHDEMGSLLKWFDNELAAATGLQMVDEQKDTHNVPKEVVLVGYNLITDNSLSEQDVKEYSSLPSMLEWLHDELVKKNGGKPIDRLDDEVRRDDVEMLLRNREYQQYLANNELTVYHLLRRALGLPQSPFVWKSR